MMDLVHKSDVLKLAVTIYDDLERPHLVVPVQCIQAMVPVTDVVPKSALLQNIAQQEGILHPCDRLEVDNIKQMIMDCNA